MTILLNILFLTLWHPIHVSMTNIEYFPQEKGYIVVVKVFSDDFTKNIKRIYNVDIDLSDAISIDKNKTVLEKYFNNALQIKIDKKTKNLILISAKTKEQATWFKLKMSLNKKDAKHVTVKNKVMNEFYRDQTNLLIFTKKNKQKAFSMNVNDTIADFSF